MSLPPNRFTYTCSTNGVWACAYMGFTGHGDTPEAARAALLTISTMMCAPWSSAPMQ